MLDPTFAEMYSDPKARIASAEDLITAMDEDGVDVSVAMGIGWADPGLARESNDYIADSVGRFPGRIVGFGAVNPTHTGAISEVRRCAGLGLRGIGELHPDTQGFDVADAKAMAPLLDALRATDLALTVHCSEPVGHGYPGKGRTTPDRVMGLVEQASGVKLVLAHWGGGLPLYGLMPEVAASLSEVFFDTAASPFLYDARVFETVASLIGPERILAASDFPLLRHRGVREQIEVGGLPQADRDAILGGNAANLLGLSPAP